MRHTLLRQALRTPCILAVSTATLCAPAHSQASFLHGEALDTMAEVVSWVAIVVAPIVIITVFWLIHILPEKIAEKRRHPQAKAIQCLCLLSLFFGGLLWPIAWLWAYTRPTLHKLAYGTDVDDSHGPDQGTRADTPAASKPELTPDLMEASELERLRSRVAELETLMAAKGGKA